MATTDIILGANEPQRERRPLPKNYHEVKELLIAILTNIQELGGNDLPVFDDELCILMEVSMFDSQTAIEAEMMIEERLETEIPDNLFFDPRTGFPATLRCVDEQICRLLEISSDHLQA